MDRRRNRAAYQYATALALAGTVLLIWLSLGVGIIGKDGDPANLMYFGVLATGVTGTITARFKAHGMATTLFAMAGAQALITTIALVAQLGVPWSGPAEILLLNAFFVVLFAGSACMFRYAARV